jgi:hypothetical protein
MSTANLGSMSLADLMKYLQQAMPGYANTGLTGEDLQAMVQAATQQNIASLNAGSQLAQNQQTNALRMYELFGADANGAPTDAANRWRQELAAQQQVQGQRLNQELMQMLGYNPNNPGQTTLQKETADRERARQWAELMGFEYNPDTGQSGRQTLQGQAQAADLSNKRAALYGVGDYGQTLEKQRLDQEATQAAAERNLRLQLQSGQLNQQEAEFARTYLLQQDENRRQNQTMAGYMDNGQLTEAARAARAGELGQRAATAAQLLGTPKDIFRAGAYFKNAAMLDPTGTGMGNGGGGIAGFSAGIDRANLPQTLGLDELERTLGAPAGGYSGTQGYAVEGTPPGGFPVPGATKPPGVWGVPANGGSTTNPVSAWTDSGTPTNRMTDENSIPGMSPGGPQGAPPLSQLMAVMGRGVTPGPGAGSSGRGPRPVAPPPPTNYPRGINPPPSSGAGQGGARDQMAQVMGTLGIGMGAGGMMPGREPPSVAPQQIPFVDPRVLEDPAVKTMLQDLKAMSRQQIEKRAKPDKVKKEIENPKKRGYSPQGHLEADRRALRGLSRLRSRAVQPGMEPGGPVAAPLWPAGGTATSMPQLQAPSSLGLDTAAAPAPTSLPSGGVNIPQQTDQRLAAIAELLINRGPGGLAPQTLERMSKTHKGVAEGAVDALGLDWGDFEQAYAQSRFKNVGNALSA